MASPSQADISTESGDSPAYEHDHAVTNEDGNVHVNGAPAIVAWTDEQSQETKPVCLSTPESVTLHIHRDTSLNTAFFQLRASIALKMKRVNTQIFLSIQPERIRSVTVVDEDEHQASANLGTTTYGLEFKLVRPPALIVPKGDLTPRKKVSRFIIDSFRTLARQTSFVVYLATTTLARSELVSLCEATSSGSLRSTPTFMDVASLYGGKGGMVIEHAPDMSVTAEAAATSAGAHAESPPSYDELGPGPGSSCASSNESKVPPPPPQIQQEAPGLPRSAEHRNKRRRASSGSEQFAPSSSHKCMSKDMQAICSKMLEHIDHGFSELNTRMGRMEQRLTDLETSVKCHADKLEGSIERVNQSSSERVEELRDELEYGLYDVRKETDDIITSRVDDELYAAQQELHEHVQDEMAEVEQRVGRRLQESLNNASLSLDINWNNE